MDAKAPGVAPAKTEVPADRDSGDKLPKWLWLGLAPQGPSRWWRTTCSLWLTYFFQGLTQEPTRLPQPLKLPELSVGTPASAPSTHPVGHSLRSPAPSASQRERQALQDLLELAGEGLPASPCSRDLAGSGGAAGETPTLRASPPRYQGHDGRLGPQAWFTLSDGRRWSLWVLSFLLKGECDSGESVSFPPALTEERAFARASGREG